MKVPPTSKEGPAGHRRHRDRGQVLVLFVLALVLVLIPAAGLGIDGSRAYEERRAAQIAADQAAIAATRASCVPASGTPPDPIAKGLNAARENGYDNGGVGGESGNTVTIVSTGTYRYTATIKSRIPGTFARVIGAAFNRFDVTVTATAAGSNCGTTVAGGPGTGPVYAGGSSCPGGSLNNIQISGDRHLVTGVTQTNGSFYNGGSGSTFDARPEPAVRYVGTFTGGSNTYLETPEDINAVPTPAWPAGWAPTDMPAWTSTEPFWKAYRDKRVNTGSATPSSLNVTADGVWYSENTGGLDVTGITAGVKVVIVSARGPLKLPTDLSTSNLVGRNFTPFNDPVLPRQNVILLSGFSHSQPCDQFAIEKSGNSGTFRGIIWAPKAMVRWSGNEATLYGCIVSHAFQMNGNDHELHRRAPDPADPDYCASSSGSTNPQISLVQ